MESKDNFSLIEYSFLLFVIGILVFSERVVFTPIFYVFTIAYFLLCIREMQRRGGLKLSIHSPMDITLLMFIILVVLSYLWQEGSSAYTLRIRTLSQTYIACILTEQWMNNEEKVIKSYKMIVLASFVNALYRVYGYLSHSNTIIVIGNNTVAIEMVVSTAISLYLFSRFKNKYYLFAAFTFTFIAFLTASRKGLLGIFLVYLVMIMFNNRTFIWRKIVLLVIALGVVYWVLENIPGFEYTRARLIGMVDFYRGAGGDYSTSIRDNLIKIGLESFKEKPFLGHGVSFSAEYLSPSYGYSNIYLHNNYVELLVSLGIIGLILFYAPHAYIAIYAIKNNKYSGAYLLCIAICLAILICDYGAVSYFDKFTILIVYIVTLHVKMFLVDRYRNNC